MQVLLLFLATGRVSLSADAGAGARVLLTYGNAYVWTPRHAHRLSSTQCDEVCPGQGGRRGALQLLHGIFDDVEPSLEACVVQRTSHSCLKAW